MVTQLAEVFSSSFLGLFELKLLLAEQLPLRGQSQAFDN
jgi:hypothetical protein